jgi:hypothetical protein
LPSFCFLQVANPAEKKTFSICLRADKRGMLCAGVARWHIFKPENLDWAKFWSVLQFKMLATLYAHSVYFTAISYILCAFGIFCGNFGIFFPVLVCCTRKNLAAPSVRC